ncbi:tripartite tricarboxylate transporter TctB family protein [Variovorax sp. WS11]|uniref:tripartite tricarboxylate transporter TctB family protein n=1 Tax=Variovorax sp. WS11 TaxID=1105204 RepID=UPI000D0DBD32|nr:tripartite tricarboxylate transporter TctB family protein [Variovorax sp. WS11]NDZ11410.1 tripartite tricarboxylate transporter TctB family protein [Variovorax sp. WS11]PSL82054.1 tripartite tricarboxylate transporter TctB family protein [Variovorax sp. WS11]
MRIHDSLIGAALLLLSLAVLWHIQGFPPAAGQNFGPALFPGLAAAGLALCSLALTWQGLRSGQPLLVLGEGLRSPRRLAAFAIVIASMAFYILLADRLGFVLCSLLILTLLQWACGVRLPVALAVAVAATLVIHTCFYKLLKVPLPWGVLQRFAW